MAIDLNKRNRVIRKYLDGIEEHPPIEKERLTDSAGNPIDALLLDFDEHGALTQTCAIIDNDRLVKLPVDDDLLNAALSDLLQNPFDSGTIVVDTSALPRNGNDWTISLGLALMGDARYERFYGKSAERLACELWGLNAATGQREDRTITLSLDEFFDGNDQDDSIAPNLGHQHPGIRTFEEILKRIESLPEVLDVRISILEWPFAEDEEDNDMWMAGESAFVWARDINAPELEHMAEELQCNEVIEITRSPHNSVPDGGPPLSPGMRVFEIMWD